MTAKITDLNEYRAWKRAKTAWRATNPHPSQAWEKLSEADRLKWRRLFERGTRRR